MSKKHRIIRTAIKLFSRKSYDSVSLAEIAREAGTTKSNILHHFSSKIDLGETCLEHGLKEYLPLVVEAAGSPEESISRFVGQMLEFSLDNPSLSRLFLDVLRATGGKTSRFLGIFREMFAKVKDFFERCGVPNPPFRALIFLSILDGLSYDRLFLGEAFQEILIPDRDAGFEAYLEGFRRELVDLLLCDVPARRGDLAGKTQKKGVEDAERK
ncbi:MAG: TetR/AcrR family transcriptional regulator [Promethearchaeota archaeon]